MLGDITSLAITSDGRVYVAEKSPSRVSLYGRDGSFVRVMMSEGSGPGEVRTPRIAARGDTLIVFDGALGRLSRVLPTGESLRAISVHNPPPVLNHGIWILSNGAVIVRSLFQIKGAATNAIRISPLGRIDTLLWAHLESEDRAFMWEGPGWAIVGQPPFSPIGAVAFDPAGRIVIGGTKRSQWFVMSGHDTIQVVTLRDTLVGVGRRVRDSVWADYRHRLNSSFAHLDDVVREDRIPTTLPPWITLDIDPTGAWWVGRSGPNGAVASWDILVDGHVQAHVPVPAPIVNAHGLVGYLTAFGSERIALLHESATGAPWIGVYRVVHTAH